MKERPPEADPWFEKARRDLVMARRPLDDPDEPLPDMACYHAQQYAEKQLKGYLVAHEVQFNYIHDLVYLIDQCLPTAPEFKQLLRSAETLNRYVARVRYPMRPEDDPTNDQARHAIALAEEIARAVQAKLLNKRTSK